MALNYHQLHIFYTVANLGSFSAAAQSLHMTQPAVTMQMQSLEEYFGCKLFIRSTKRIELTEAGHVLLPYALRSLDLMRETEETMSRFTHQLEGRLQLGASLTIGEYILPRLLGPFGHQYPHIQILLKVMNTSQIVEYILQHQLNFGLVEAPVDHSDIKIEPVMEDELKLVVPAGHELERAGGVDLETVIKHPFVLREKGSGTRQVMENELQRQNIMPDDLNVVMELGSTGAVKSAVEAGFGITMLSPSSVKHEVALGLLRTVNIRNVSFKRRFFAIHLKSTLLPISAVTFLNFIKQPKTREDYL